MNPLEEIDDTLKIDGRGRKSVLCLNRDNYFNEYYHLTKKNVKCECGIVVVSVNLKRHKQTKSHLNQLEFNDKIESK